MKTHWFFTLTVGITIALATAPVHAQPGGTTIRHFMLRAPLEGTGVDSNASGKVDLRLNQQGAADIQHLKIDATRLDTNSVYTLLALLRGDTNLTEVTTFSTGARGSAHLHYKRVGHLAASGRGQVPAFVRHRGPPHSFPDEFNPLFNLQALVIENAATQAVLTADLTTPKRLHYLIKRRLTGNGVKADFRLHATTRFTQFRIRASGLETNAPHFLSLNETNLTAFTSDAHGELRIEELPTNAPANILDLESVALLDGGTNVIVSTTLP